MMQPLATAIPTARQLEYQSWELGLFLHFGIRAFYEGYKDFDKRPMDPKAFNPTHLDCDQWIWTAKRAGFKYAVMTAKHHDGFANWPSAYTKFSVASSPWKDGKGDVVKEFIEACHRHGLAAGLYYSPYDHNHPSYADPKAYDDYFINQVSEILSGYGKIDMLWFDACGSGDHKYDWPRIIRHVRELQKDLLIFEMADPQYRWVGNEAGVAPFPFWNTKLSTPLADVNKPKETVTQVPVWMPAECDMRMRLERWFYDDAEMHTVKSVEELMGLYHFSVGRGCNMLVNIGPDRRGLLPENETDRLVEFGQAVKRQFASPFASLGDFKREGNSWSFQFPSNTLLEHIVLQEDIRRGEHIRRFRISTRYPNSTDPITLWEGYNVGQKAICRIPALRVWNVCVEVLESDGECDLTAIGLYGPAR